MAPEIIYYFKYGVQFAPNFGDCMGVPEINLKLFVLDFGVTPCGLSVTLSFVKEF